MHPSRTSGAPVAYSSTGDVSGTYRPGILGSRPCIWLYVSRHQKKQELCTGSGRRRSGFVVELRNSSAAANWPEAENPLSRTTDCQDKGDLDLQASFVA